MDNDDKSDDDKIKKLYIDYNEEQRLKIIETEIKENKIKH